ncbi:MAG: endonuclease/exonuclease/phosphatase family protein [Acidobacteriota bacterium]|nr:endonuclease/exonuclease/phosphatase family protein [Acidobacteriota bacterium]
MRIATWNLERLPTAWRRSVIQSQLREVNADIWILTETSSGLSPGKDYKLVSSGAPDRLGDQGEVWVAIWSRFPIRQIDVFGDPARSAAASISLPNSQRLGVCGTVLPWRGSPWRSYPSAGAVAFSAALEAQKADWHRINAEHDGLCVAGDFNQDLSAKSYYWSAKARALLSSALAECNLQAVTADPTDPVRTLTQQERASIDHICLPRQWHTSAPPVAWPRFLDGRPMSDHFGVYVDLPDA